MKRANKAARLEIVRGLAAIIAGAETQRRVEALDRSRNTAARERARVATLIGNDQVERERELKRRTALGEMACGGYTRADDIAIPPPPEHARRGKYVPYRAEKIPGTARSIMTVRNLASDRPAQLYHRGVIDAELYVALAWYRRTWELSGLAPRTTSSYAERSTATPNYGHMAKTEEQVEARQEYRWARAAVPADVIELFEAIVLHDRTLKEEGEDSSEVAPGATKYRNTKAAFMRAALILFERVRPILQIVY